MLHMYPASAQQVMQLLGWAFPQGSRVYCMVCVCTYVMLPGLA